jgi:hypothetical protein
MPEAFRRHWRMPVVRCSNCLAPLRLDLGRIVACDYCRAQTRLDVVQIVATPVASGARLAEGVGFVTPMGPIPFLEANAPLPIFRTETLSTGQDSQPALQVNLVQGTTQLARFEFPLRARAPRGVPKIGLTVRVAARGEMSLTLIETGTDNALDRAGLTARVA